MSLLLRHDGVCDKEDDGISYDRAQGLAGRRITENPRWFQKDRQGNLHHWATYVPKDEADWTWHLMCNKKSRYQVVWQYDGGKKVPGNRILRIRAQVGHSTGGKAAQAGRDMVLITPEEAPELFHMTRPGNVDGIWKYGVIPGGPSGGRAESF